MTGVELLTCAHCGVTSPSVKKCTGCLSAGFCSVDHQRLHWKIHKKVCGKNAQKGQKEPIKNNNNNSVPVGPLFSIGSSSKPFETKCCIASQDIPKGTIIHDELPIFQYGNDYNLLNEVVDCVTCGNLTQCSKKNCNHKHVGPRVCSRCKWPVCSDGCEDAEIHRENECKVFCASDLTDVEKTGNTLIIARSFGMRSRKPKIWDEILSLCPNYHLELKDKLHPELYYNLAKQGKSTSNMISKFPKFRFGQEPIVEYEILKQLSCISPRVGFQVGRTSAINPNTYGTFLYKKGSNFTSSCVPNCLWIIGPFPDFKLRIISAVDIKKGQVLTVVRHTAFYIGVVYKLELFMDVYNRPCFCDLCIDPTELGTYQSAIVCTRCKTRNKKGYLLPPPPQPIPNRDSADVLAQIWTCSNCGERESSTAFIQKIRTIFQSLLRDKSNTIPRILEEECGTFLHENHWIVQQSMVEYRHTTAINFPALPEILSSGGTKDHEMMVLALLEFERTLEYFTKVAAILDKTLPGLQHERMRILQKITAATTNLCAFYTMIGEIFNTMDRSNITKLKDNLDIAVSFCDEVKLFWKHSFPPRGEDDASHHASLLEECDQKTEKVKSLFQIFEKRVKSYERTADKTLKESTNITKIPSPRLQIQDKKLDLSPTVNSQNDQENKTKVKNTPTKNIENNTEESKENPKKDGFISTKEPQALKKLGEKIESIKSSPVSPECVPQKNNDPPPKTEKESLARETLMLEKGQENDLKFNSIQKPHPENSILGETLQPGKNEPEENLEVNSKCTTESTNSSQSQTEDSQILNPIQKSNSEKIKLKNESNSTERAEFKSSNSGSKPTDNNILDEEQKIPNETTKKKVELENATESAESSMKSETTEESSSESAIPGNQLQSIQIQEVHELTPPENETGSKSTHIPNQEVESNLNSKMPPQQKTQLVQEVENSKELDDKQFDSNSNFVQIQEIENTAENFEPDPEPEKKQELLLISEQTESKEKQPGEISTANFNSFEKLDVPIRNFSQLNQKFIIHSEMLTFIQFQLKKGMEKSKIIQICLSFYSIPEIQQGVKLLALILSLTDQTLENFTLENSLNDDTTQEEEAELTLQVIVTCLEVLGGKDNAHFEFGASNLDQIPTIPTQIPLSEPAESQFLKSNEISTSKFPLSLDLLKNCKSLSPAQSQSHSVDLQLEKEPELELELDRVSMVSQNSSLSTSSSKKKEKLAKDGNLVVGSGPPLVPIQIQTLPPPQTPSPLAMPTSTKPPDDGLDLNSMENLQSERKTKRRETWELFVTGYPISYDGSRIHQHLEKRGFSNVSVEKLPSKSKSGNPNGNGNGIGKTSSFQITFDTPSSKRLCRDVYSPAFWPRGCRLVRRWHEPKNKSNSYSSSDSISKSHHDQAPAFPPVQSSKNLRDENPSTSIVEGARHVRPSRIQKCLEILNYCSIL